MHTAAMCSSAAPAPLCNMNGREFIREHWEETLVFQILAFHSHLQPRLLEWIGLVGPSKDGDQNTIFFV